MHRLLLLSLLPLLLVACGDAEAPAPPPPTPTAAMVAELRAIAEARPEGEVWHLNAARASAIDRRLPTVRDPGERISLLFEAGTQWLNAGDYTLAIERYDEIFRFVTAAKLDVPEGPMRAIEEMRAVAWLRKAEIENCLRHHNAYSCILPIAEPGQHVERGGATTARRLLGELLEADGQDVQARWLYNIAGMALGEWPDGIPAERRIPPEVFASDRALPRFTDRAMELGVAVADIAGSVVLDDFDNDDRLDLLVSSYGLDDQLRFFRNDGRGGFEDRTEQAGLRGLWSGLNMVQADYDNDGWLDVLVLRGAWLSRHGQHPNSLLRNNGDGTFSDVTRAAGLYSRLPTQTASWADFDNDGWLDLFIGNEHSSGIDAPCQLYHNRGDGTFREVAQEHGLALEAFVKGCVWGDYDNDGDPDLYVTTVTGANHLFRNDGTEDGVRFTDVAATAGVTDPRHAFPCWFFDFDQDGWEDLFVSGFDFGFFETAAGEVARDYLGLPTEAEKPRLFRNQGDGTFRDVTRGARLDTVLFTMGCNYGDLDNDGFPDFYAGTGTPDFRALIPNRMFLNGGGAGFLDVTSAGGFGHLQKGHGVAFGDVDHDGDQDIYHVLGGSYDGDNFMNALFENPGAGGAWVKLKLVGETANRAAIGARVAVFASAADGRSRTFHSRVSSGASFGANPLRVEQGLGDYATIERVEILWPGESAPQRLEGIEAGALWLVRQGAEPERVALVPTPLQGGGHAHH